MQKELRLSETDYSLIETWNRELQEEYEEIEYLDGFNEISIESEEYID